jgi:ankyrin repeat protein
MMSYVSLKNLLSPRARNTSTSSSVTSSPSIESKSLTALTKKGSEAEMMVALTSKAISPHDYSGPDGCNLLHLACRKGWAKVCDELLTSHDFDIFSRDRRKCAALHYAVLFHQEKVIKLLVDKFDAKFDVVNANGNTPIHIACHHGYRAITEYALSLDQLDLKKFNEQGDTPFHLACMYKYMTEHLMSTGVVDLALCNHSNLSPVEIACNQGRWDVALYLVTEHNCNPNGVDCYGNTLLHELSRKGYRDTIKYVALMEGGVDMTHRNRYGDTALHVATYHAQMNVVDFFINEGKVDINCRNNRGLTPSEVAIARSHWAVALKLIVDHQSSPLGNDLQGNTSLHGACMVNNLPAVEYIVSTGQVPIMYQNFIGDSCLHIACYNGEMGIVEFLMRQAECRCQATNMEGNTPLHFASMAGHANIIRYLIQEGRVNISCVNKAGNTPLHLSCEYGHTGAAAAIIEATEDVPLAVTMTNRNGKTPPDVAFQFQRWDTAVFMASHSESHIAQIERHLYLFCADGYYDLIVKVLDTLKVDVNCRDRFKNTPLHHACKSGSIDIIHHLLLIAQADPSCLNELHNAPIHTACLEGHLEAVKYLMSMESVDPNCVNKALETPLHMACSRGHLKVVCYLLKSTRVDPFPQDKEGKTPIELLKPTYPTHKDLSDIFNHLKFIVNKHNIKSYTKVFVCGDCNSGKTSLIRIVIERSGNHRKSFRGVLNKRHIGGIVPNTRGIAIDDICIMPEMENIRFFDLSGDPAYHPAHLSYLRHLNRESPSVLLVTVNVRLSDKEIKDQLTYWYRLMRASRKGSGLEGRGSDYGCGQDKVIVVGTHVDNMEPREEARLKNLIDEVMTQLMEGDDATMYISCHFLNCTKLYSKRLVPFFYLLLDTCKMVPGGHIKEPYCQLMYDFLLEKVKEKAITLSNLAYIISSHETCLLPTKMSVIDELLVPLSQRGLISIVRPNRFINATWIIIDQKYICHDVLGELYAPPTSPTHKFPPSFLSGGVLPTSTLETTFPGISLLPLVETLTGLGLCHCLNVKVLHQLNTNLPLQLDNQEQLVFPSHVSLDEIGVAEGVASKAVGWCYHSDGYNHPAVSSYLTQVLMIGLLKEYCSLTGASTFKMNRTTLYWTTHDGINVTFKTRVGHTSFTVIMTYSDDTLMEHLKLRSSLIAYIRQLLEDCLPAVDFTISLVPTEQAMKLNDHQFVDVELYDVREVERAILDGQQTVSMSDTCTADIAGLIISDPYLSLSTELYHQLHNPSLINDVVPTSLVEQVNQYFPDIKLLEDDAMTYGVLKDKLDQLTIISDNEVDDTSPAVTKCTNNHQIYNNIHRSKLLSTLKDVKNWNELGRCLKLPEDLLQGLIMANPEREEAIKLILTVWLDRDGSCEASNKVTLRNALVSINENHIATLI